MVLAIGNVPPHRRPNEHACFNPTRFSRIFERGKNVSLRLLREGMAKDVALMPRVAEMLKLVKCLDRSFARRKPDQFVGRATAACGAGARRWIKTAQSCCCWTNALRRASTRNCARRRSSKLVRIQESLRYTCVVVTHDQDEAMTIAHPHST